MPEWYNLNISFFFKYLKAILKGESTLTLMAVNCECSFVLFSPELCICRQGTPIVQPVPVTSEFPSTPKYSVPHGCSCFLNHTLRSGDLDINPDKDLSTSLQTNNNNKKYWSSPHVQCLPLPKSRF